MNAMSRDEQPVSGLGGSLKFIIILAVLALALLAGLVVLEVVPPESFAAIAAKVLALTAIALLASVAVWALLRSGTRA